MIRRLGLKATALAVLAVGIAASAAQAGGVLTTMPVYRAERAFSCQLTNGGKGEVEVNVERRSSDGTVLGQVPFVIPPGGARVYGAPDFGGGQDDIVYCRFVGLKGNKRDLRAGYCVRESGSVDSPCVDTGEAR